MVHFFYKTLDIRGTSIYMHYQNVLSLVSWSQGWWCDCYRISNPGAVPWKPQVLNWWIASLKVAQGSASPAEITLNVQSFNGQA